MKNTKFVTLIVAAALLTGCSSNLVQSGAGTSPQESGSTANITESAEPSASSETVPGTAELDNDAAVTSESPTIAEMLGVADYEAPWSRADYPELEISQVPAKGRVRSA